MLSTDHECVDRIRQNTGAISTDTDEMVQTQRTAVKAHARGKARVVVVALICAVIVAGAEFYVAFLR